MPFIPFHQKFIKIVSWSLLQVFGLAGIFKQTLCGRAKVKSPFLVNFTAS